MTVDASAVGILETIIDTKLLIMVISNPLSRPQAGHGRFPSLPDLGPDFGSKHGQAHHTLKTKTSFVPVSALLIGLVLCFAQPARAGTFDWSATAADTLWASGSNWVGGTAPADSLTTDIARFNQTSYANQPNYGTRSIGGLIFGDGVTTTDDNALPHIIEPGRQHHHERQCRPGDHFGHKPDRLGNILGDQ